MGNKSVEIIGNIVIYLTIFLFWGFLLHQKRIMLHVCDKCNLYIIKPNRYICKHYYGTENYRK